MIPVTAYEKVRAQDDRFVVRPGHETPDLEYAIDWTDQYVIVDKVAAAEWRGRRPARRTVELGERVANKDELLIPRR